MKKPSLKKIIATCAILTLTLPFSVNAEGSRYDLPRAYQSEISAAKAYLNMNTEKAVLVDVRRLREYAAGHPEKAFNVPYPHVVGSNDQDPEVFYWTVYNLVGGKTDTAVMTLCRTGFRSVLAANILADPQNTAGDPARPVIAGASPFTNVHNIWEGFVGKYKEADGSPGNYLDLNNNDVLDSDSADVYAHTKDANPDKDGWRNYQDLPWGTRLHVNRVYLNDMSMYDAYVQ